MDISVLGESLKMAVDQAFELGADVKNEITQDANEFSIAGHNEVLSMARLNQQPGLRERVAAAYVSGDIEEIEIARKLAFEQAESGVRRNIARIAVQNTQKNSRMRYKRSKFKRLGA